MQFFSLHDLAFQINIAFFLTPRLVGSLPVCHINARNKFSSLALVWARQRTKQSHDSSSIHSHFLGVSNTCALVPPLQNFSLLLLLDTTLVSSSLHIPSITMIPPLFPCLLSYLLPSQPSRRSSVFFLLNCKPTSLDWCAFSLPPCNSFLIHCLPAQE